MPTKNDFYGFETDDYYISIDGNEIHGISEFNVTYSEKDEMIKDYVDKTFNIDSSGSFTFITKIIWDTFYKLTGFYDWVCKSCPNKRVVHLIKHGKNERIKRKNFFRAIRIIAKLYI